MTTISPTTLPLSAGTWTADPSHTTVGFVVRHLGLSKVRGRFDGVTAQLTAGDDISTSSVCAEIDMSTVRTGTPIATPTSGRATSSTPTPTRR